MKSDTAFTKKIRLIYLELKEAIRGTEQDFTKGSLSRAIVLLSIPMVLEMLMESIFAVADIYFVSQLGAEQVATVGITESLLTLIYAIGIGLSMATTAMVSRRMGEKKPQEAASVAMQAIWIGVLSSLFLSFAGLFYSENLLQLMGASDMLIQNGSIYPAIMLGGNVVIMLLFIINAIFRSAGDAATSMRILWIANMINIALDPLLIYGIGPFPEMGIAGAAIATLTGRGIAVLYQFYLLFYGGRRIQLKTSDVIVIPSIIKRLLRLSLGGIGQNIIATSSWIGLMRIMALFGDQVLAGYTIAIRVVVFSLLPTWGLSNAAATLVGQNLGANQPRRAEKSVWITASINTCFLLFFAVFFYAIPEHFIKMFIKDGTVISYGSTALRIISYGYLFYGMGMVLPQAFNGAGDTRTPTIINFISFWIIEIILAYLLSIELNWKENGVFYAIVISESFMALLSAILFKRGSWKLTKV